MSEAGGPMGRRWARLARRLRATQRPVVWLRAPAGSGKTRLAFEPGPRKMRAAAPDWLLLDEPASGTLREMLVACTSSPGRPGRLLVASRTHTDIEDVLLTARLYGQVETIDESELFLQSCDCPGHRGEELLAVTGGWPVLADGLLSGRAHEMMEMLPAFLDREVLPDLAPAVVTAMFGALAAPLGAAAVQHLFGGDSARALHPFLEQTPAGWVLASRWVHDALLKLRTRPKALRRAVLEALVVLHARHAEPAQAILALLDLGQVTEAVEVFEAAGGIFFGYRHGFHALERVLERLGPERERNTESLFFARLYLMIKSGQVREALLRLDSQHPGLPVDLRRLRLSHRPYALLLRIDLSLDIDENPPLEVIASWGRLEALFPPGDTLARGLLYNTMAIGFLQAGALVEARELAEEALATFERAGSPYLAHFMLLHLCDLSLRHGRLRHAALELRRAEEALTVSGHTFNSEPAIMACFRARIAYEEGRFADCPTDIEPILQALLRGDSWSDLIAGLAGCCVFAVFWQQGLRKALESLDHCALTLSRRHGPTQNRGLELVRIRLYQAARRHEEARVRFEEYAVDVVHPAGARRTEKLAVEESLIRLRELVVDEHPTPKALKFAASLANRPGIDARQAIALGILLASLRQRQGDRGAARRHLAVALRNAESEGLLAVLVEHGEFLARLLPLVAAKPGPGNARIAAFAERVARLLQMLPATPAHAKRLAGVTRQEHRVLSYVTEGYTNKQIARALGLSEGAIKFHLGNLFRKLGVASRGALAEAADVRGFRT